MDQYREHSIYSDPGSHEQAMSKLPENASSLLQLAKHLLVLPEEIRRPDHVYKKQQLKLYHHFIHIENVLGFFLERSPELQQLVEDKRLALPAEHQALLLCCLFRQRKISARMRAGFAYQTNTGLWRGHWFCEWRVNDIGNWHRSDLLDAGQELDHQLNINGSEAWERRKELDCSLFRHERLKGLSAIKRFLLYDFHCLAKQEMVHYEWQHTGGGKGPALFYRSASSLTRAQWQQLDNITEICQRVDSRPDILSSEFERYISDGETARARKS